MRRNIGKYKDFVILLLLIYTTVSAQSAEVATLGNNSSRGRTSTHTTRDTANSHDITIRYENDKAWPRWSYANNRQAYASLVKTINRLVSEQNTLRAVVIEAAASPIGSDEYNYRLALRRAEILRNIIRKMKGAENLRINTISAGEDWDTFHNYIEQHYHRPNRNKVLSILSTNLSNDNKERALQALDGGKTWQILVNHFMASARNAAVIRIVEIADLAPKSPSLKFEPAPIVFNPEWIDGGGLQFAHKFEPEPEEFRKPVLAFRSNLLVPALNIGIEVPIGNHWSMAADYYYPWIWPKRDNKNCFELLAWGIEGRYWFGRERTPYDRLQGHSMGLYGYMGYYDFERNYHGAQGEFINVGIDYTYSLAVGKRKSIHFEFSLGVGYIYSQARKYSVIESQGPLISEKITKRVGYFGPTKANVSLVVPIFQRVKPNERRQSDE